MKHKITRDINRIGLHDSHILSFKLADNFICLKFDWAKLTSYEEENLKSLVLGDCELRLNGIQEAILENETDVGNNEIDFPKNFPEGFEEILVNDSKNDNELALSGFMTINGDSLWITWKIKFDEFGFFWDTHVTSEEWKNGALP